MFHSSQQGPSESGLLSQEGTQLSSTVGALSINEAYRPKTEHFGGEVSVP